MPSPADLRATVTAGDRGLALVAGDLVGDGGVDIVVAGAAARGGVVVVYRGNRAMRDMPGAALRAVAPLVGSVARVPLPVAIDLVVVADVDADGWSDVVAGARGDRRLWILRNDGSGLMAPTVLTLPAELTALASGDVNRRDGLDDLVVAVAGAGGSRLLVYESPRGALDGDPEVVPLPEPASAVVCGELDGGFGGDVAAAAGSELVLVHGRDRHLAVPAGLRERVAPPAVDMMALPAAVWSLTPLERRGSVQRLAVALADGTTRVLDAGRPEQSGAVLERGWRGPPLLVAARVAGSPAGSLVSFDSTGVSPALVAVAPVASADGAAAPRPWTVARTALDVATPVTAAVATRLDGDALDDLVVLTGGDVTPTVLLATVAAVYTVNSTADPGDGACDGTECTLREAITAANANPGQDTIEFAIGSGHQVITPTSYLPALTESVIIDGTTQPGYSTTPLIELNGSSLTINGYGLVVQGGGSTVKGLVINNFNSSGVLLMTGSSNTVRDCFIGTDAAGIAAAGNRYGIEITSSNNQVLDNLISANDDGVYIHGAAASANEVAGNLIGTDATGSSLPTGLGSPAAGVQIEDAADTTVGGAKVAERNVISGASDGVVVFGATASGTIIQSNLVGTDSAGTGSLGNQFFGVLMQNAPSTTVGSFLAGAGNVISGNGGDGVGVRGADAIGNLVIGNLIGADSSGEADLGNGGAGVLVRYGATNTSILGDAGFPCVVGGNAGSGVLVEDSGTASTTVAGCRVGVTPSSSALGNDGDGITVDGDAGPNAFGDSTGTAGNVIAHNGGAGVSVLSGSGNAIRANAITANTTLGIDLGGDGVTANDGGDGDTGANGLQNFPVLTRVETDGSGLVLVEGTLDSAASTTFDVDLFRSPSCDGSGHGEGAAFLGSATLTTGGSGTGTFSATFAATVAPGAAITATATGPTGDTSELSACFTAPAAVLIFADGFEGGDATAWSAAVP